MWSKMGKVVGRGDIGEVTRENRAQRCASNGGNGTNESKKSQKKITSGYTRVRWRTPERNRGKKDRAKKTVARETSDNWRIALRGHGEEKPGTETLN